MNKFLNKTFSALTILALVLMALPLPNVQAVSSTVVISQVYGGGGNSGSTYTNDFIELFNRGAVPTDLTGWSVQYASATGTSWAVTPLTGVILQPGQYYLIQEAQGSGGSTLLPTPDATGSIAMSATAGKVALVNVTVALSGSGCPFGASVVDFAGFGMTANCYEGSGATPAPSNVNAVLRASNGCTDTDANNTDFSAGAPIPRNTASPLNPCGGGDQAPAVSSVTPGDGATNIAVNANIDVTFSEPVNAGGGSFTVSCGTSGAHTFAVSGGPTTFSLDPDADFANSETCTVTVLAAQVTDQDANDPPDNMTDDHVFSFDTASAAPPVASLVINEIDYDQPGTDTAEFIEIKNVGADAVDLDNYSIQMINGNGGAQYQLIDLPAVNLAAGDYFVVCANAGNTPNCDLDVTPNTDLIQNGAPDAVAILLGITVIDAVSYEGDTVAPYTEGSGTGLEDPGTTGNVNLGISRFPDGVDTNQNNVDLSLRCITPGEANSSSASGCVLDLPPAVASTNPINSAAGVAVSNNIDVNFTEPVNVTGIWFSISCANSGTHTAAVSGGPQNYTLDPDADFAFSESCSVTIAAANVADQDGAPQNMTADYNFGFTTGAQPFVCGDPATFIHDVQGNGPASPLVGNVVTIEGIVISSFQGMNQLGGFHVQEEDADADANPLTSEGVFVYNSANAPSVGDKVRVQATVDEFNGLTELKNVTSFLSCSTGNPLPAATSLSLPVTSVSDFESFEGMRVTFPQPLVISEYFNFARFGEIVLTSERHLSPTAKFDPGSNSIQAAQDYLLDKITLDDGRSAQNPDPAIHPDGGVFDLTNLFRGGDTVANVTGIMDFSFGIYRIQPTQGADYVNANPREAAPEDVEGRLRIASMNTLNFFLTLDTTNSDTGPGPCGGNANLDCRGADANQPLEFSRQRDKLIVALSSLNADVIGLNELENTPGVSPLGDPTNGIVAGLNANYGPGVYSFIDTGVIGTDAIRVGLVYKTTTVVPVGNFQILDSTDDSRFLDTKSRPSLAQTFEEIATGERFTVVVNHFKSKGSPCTDIGDPDLGDGQGNCSQTRKAAAEALVDWIATDPTGSNDPDFLIMGDLNSYDKEESIDAILAGGFSDITYQLKGEDAYSYVFDGQTGYLDYMLANNTLFDQVTGITDWHINSDEPSLIDYDTSFKQDAQDAIYNVDAYRTSDHDPVLLGLNLLPQCNGKNATVYVRDGVIVGGLHDGQPYNGSLIGTNGDDVIVGTDSHDTIFALSGNDTVCALGASDAVFGGTGDDTLLGGDGNDVLFGGAGNDVIEAGEGNDAAFGESGNDTVNGGAGKDAIDGGSGTDTVTGGDENDVIRGGSGADALDGGAGNDVCNGGSGTDTDVLCEVRIQLP